MTLRQLHSQGLLILPNVWDAGNARLVESRGAKALATTSAAVAWAHGYADGNALPVSLLHSTVASIVRVIRVPLSVDIEGGYSDDPAAVGEVVAGVLDAGGVGINIEDDVKDPSLLVAKIDAARRAAERAGVDLFINARTDVYLRGLASEAERVEMSIQRAAIYKSAGADGIFVPGVVAPDEIRALASQVDMPLNVLARPGLPGAKELESLGVRRLSAGSGLAQAFYGQVAKLAGDFLADGNSDALVPGAMPYVDINALMMS